jgi:intracellular multiplication protein IcmG
MAQQYDEKENDYPVDEVEAEYEEATPEEGDSSVSYADTTGSNLEYDTSEGITPKATAVAGVGTEVSSSKMSNKNKVFLWIIFVLAIFIVYKVVTLVLGPIHLFIKSSSTISQLPPAVVKPVVVQQPIITTPSVQSVKVGEEQSVLSSDLNDKLGKLQTSSETLAKTLDQQKQLTQDHMQTLDQKVSDVQKSMTELERVIGNLNTQLTQQAMAAKIEKQIQSQRKQVQNKRIRVQKQYFVEAVIPGRAWLRGADGSALTVTVGDHLEGYGQVLSVNSYDGTVATSSGTKILYGING